MRETPELAIPQIPRKPGATAQEHAYLRLRNALMTGTLEPGTPLRIRALAARMDISPTPIREALRRLTSENALQVLDNRRIIVATMTAERFEELVHLRVNLESLAAQRAMPYVSDHLIGQMKDIDDRMDEAIEHRSFDNLTLLNQQFHETLYRANINQSALPLIRSIWLQLGPFHRQVINSVMDYYVVDRHKEILAALEKRDSMALGIAIEADIRDGIGRAGRDEIRKILA